VISLPKERTKTTPKENSWDISHFIIISIT